MAPWRSQSLKQEHETTQFDCGNGVLNQWLVAQSWRAQVSDSARTYVWTLPDSMKILAYYSIAPTQIVRDEISSGQAGGLSVVPAYLIARLALDRSLHGQKLGSELLVDALETIVRAAKTAAGRLIVVDAIDDSAVTFYLHHDFQPVKGNPRRLVMKVTTARNALAQMSLQIKGDRATRLVSMLFELPNGTTVPVLVSPEESQELADLLEKFLESTDNPDAKIDFREVIRTVLGRDPFAEHDD